MSDVEYVDSRECGEQFRLAVEKLIIDNGLKEICDIGGGANPLLSEDFQKEHGVNYTLLDVSQDELDKAPSSYYKVKADILDSSSLPQGKWELIFSQTLAEHVKDGQQFHENVYGCLKPGGYAMHIFPTMYAIPFIANRLLPERIASKVLDMLVPRDRYQHDKFPAYYSWCYGPTKKMLGMLRNIGYKIEKYQGLFGHRYYKFLPPLHKIQECYVKILLNHPNPYQTSYAIQVLRKSSLP